MFSGFYILYKAYHNIVERVEVREIGVNLWVMTFSIAVTAFLVIFLKRVAAREKSAVLEADSLHYQVDLLSNGGVLIALILIKITGLHIIDSLVSIAIAMYIIYSAVKLNLSVTKELLDTSLSDEQLNGIKNILDEYSDEIVDIHKLRTRSSGGQNFIDMHLVLDYNMTLGESGRVRKEIEDKIKSAIDDADVNIYIEPCKPEQCSKCDVCEGDGEEF